MAGNESVYEKKMQQFRSEVLSQISHNARTPLNTIMGLADVAALHMDDKERVEECLKKISESGAHLLNLLNNVVDMNKLDRGELLLTDQWFDVQNMIHEIIKNFQKRIDEKHLHVTIDDTQMQEAHVYGDREHIVQVLRNVIDNAIRYTTDGGEVTIRICQDKGKQAGYEKYQFTIKDNGRGMTKEFMNRLYQPFEREVDLSVYNEEGSGLGMPISKKLLELMAGIMQVESVPNEGTTVTVTLELKVKKQEYADQLIRDILKDYKLLNQVDLKGKRILLVDDYRLNLDITAELLENQGFQVESVINGYEALREINEHEEYYYDFVLMDIQMPLIDGYETTEQIRHLDREDVQKLPIIAMTANAFEKDVEMAQKYGMDGHIAKPLDMDTLIKMMRKITMA